MLNKNNSVKTLPSEKSTKEKKKLFHVEKRFNMATWQSILIRFAFILIAIFFGLLVLTMAYGIDPFASFGNLFKGAFGNWDKFWEFFRDSALLLGVGLALIPAFKMKFWNLGGNGQIAIGALACIMLMVELGGKVPDIVIVLVSGVVAVIIGAIWAAIPAIFKALFNTNESLFTLMMNYIATGLVGIYIYWRFPDESNIVPSQSYGRLPVLFNGKVLIVILIAALFVGLFFYLKYSKHGYELSVVGESINTARYVGINSKKVIIRTLILSGALCGFVGFLIASGVDFSITAENTHRGMGFTAIMAVWLAKFNPIISIGTAMFITFITKGMSQVQMSNSRYITGDSATNIVMGLIFLFVIASEFLVEYKIMYNKNGKETDVFEIIGNFLKPVANFFKKIFVPVGRFFAKVFKSIGLFFRKLFRISAKKEKPRMNKGNASAKEDK
ncbi:MAG: ABC transporter permease [Bacilli bacterium]|nr:ABC transporter permease [Bacilli bacterium]